MSTNYAPSRRATNPPVHRPSECDVAAARFEEAKAITDALVIKLSRERSELAGTAHEARVPVLRRIEITRIELTDARSYEARVFKLWEHERSAVAGKPVAGVRSDESRPHGLSLVSTISSPSERLLRPPVGGRTTTGRRGA
jgi:hypothetical protein